MCSFFPKMLLETFKISDMFLVQTNYPYSERSTVRVAEVMDGLKPFTRPPINNETENLTKSVSLPNKRSHKNIY